MRQMCIPSIGDNVTLAEDWTFVLVNEHRNKTMAIWAGECRNPDSYSYPLGVVSQLRSDVRPEWGSYCVADPRIVNVTLPKGTVLKIDRIYLRKGGKDYDSVTFIAQGLQAKDNMEVYDRQSHNYKKKPVNRSVRFFAKLTDVNKMVVEN